MVREKETAIKEKVARVMAKEAINPIKAKMEKEERMEKEMIKKEEGAPKGETGATADLIQSLQEESQEDVRHQEWKMPDYAISPKGISVKQEINAIFGTHRNVNLRLKAIAHWEANAPLGTRSRLLTPQQQNPVPKPKPKERQKEKENSRAASRCKPMPRG